MVDLLATSDAARGIRISPFTFEWADSMLAPLTNNFEEVRTAIQGIENNSGGTSVTNVMRMFNERYSDGGTGKAANPKMAILLITDGVNQSTVDGEPADMDPSHCEYLKGKGVLIYVLNIHYPDPDHLEGGAGSLDKLAKWRPHIEAAPDLLRSCASSGKYFDAYDGDAITRALLEIGTDIGKPRPLRLTQ